VLHSSRRSDIRNYRRSYVEERGSGNLYQGDDDESFDADDLAFFRYGPSGVLFWELTDGRFMFEEMIFGRYSGASRRGVLTTPSPAIRIC
jgi:hypothetical protein